MKKIFFLFVLSMAMIVNAQETKKVAILEPVDKMGEVSYANKLILRSNLAKAVTNMVGYEAYDRSDMDAIMSEQDFQRTGMVNNDQIKRLGEMTGAAYILVSEVVKVDDTHMFITAKILDVETARTDMTDNLLMGISANDIQVGCIQLATNLFKTKISTNVASSKQPVSASMPQATSSNAVVSDVAGLDMSDKGVLYIHRPFKYMGSAWGHFIEVNGIFTANVTTGTNVKLYLAPGRYTIQDLLGIGKYENVKQKNTTAQVTTVVINAGDQYVITIDEAAGMMGQAEKDMKIISKIEGKEKYAFAFNVDGSMLVIK